MDKKAACLRVEEVITPILAEEGVELVDVTLTAEMGRTILRVSIDKEGGVGLPDCQRVSHAIEDVIEVEKCVPVIYDLEVSSPGVERPLKKESHFLKAIGKLIKVKTERPIDGRGNYKGILKAAKDNEITVTVDNKDYVIPLDQIAKANVVFEF